MTELTATQLRVLRHLTHERARIESPAYHQYDLLPNGGPVDYRTVQRLLALGLIKRDPYNYAYTITPDGIEASKTEELT